VCTIRQRGQRRAENGKHGGKGTKGLFKQYKTETREGLTSERGTHALVGSAGGEWMVG